MPNGRDLPWSRRERTEELCELGVLAVRIELSLFSHVPPFEVVGDRQVEGTFAARIGFLLVSGADLGVCHGGTGIRHRLPEAFAVRLLGGTPFHLGQVGLLDDGLPAVHASEGEVVYCAVHFSKNGVEGDLCHGCLSGVDQVFRLFVSCSCTDPVLTS